MRKLYFKILLLILFITFLSVNVFSQGRRDIDGKRYISGDTSLLKGQDTSKILKDTLNVFKGDSTARIKYFVYEREFSFFTPIEYNISPLLLGDASAIKREVKFDSLGNVTIVKTLFGEPINVPLILPINEYLKKVSDVNFKTSMNNLVSEKFKGQVTNDLTKLFEKFTDITIPLPFKTETIFGPPTINLRINGTVDLTASYQSIKSEQVILSNLLGNQKNINFKQDLQITAKGTVGDKLTIDADWNTQRTFDFENQLRIRYTGYKDEVIQKIEGGNVSLETGSSLIQSSQALFGVKGDFKLGPLTLTSVFSQKKSKRERKDFTGGSQSQEFQINVFDYSDNHYFLDTIYKSSFLDYYNNTTGVISPKTDSNQVLAGDNSFEVWVQTDITDSRKRYAVAITMLPEATTVNYDTLINTNEIQGIRFFGVFRKLEQNEYYINPYAGFISLKVNIPENFVVAVTYRTKKGEKFGRSSKDKPQNSDTLVLKMVKCRNLNPEATPLAWELKLRNIYRLPVSKVIQDGFSLNIYYTNEENNDVPTIPTQSGQKQLLQIVGLDRYQGTTRNPPPDNVFDFIPGLTINVESGDIIFPTLRPFFDNISEAGADTSYFFSQLYTKVKTEAITYPIATRYKIKGTAKGEAGLTNTINLGFNVVPGSVEIYDREQKLIENVDYTVDYSTGIVVIRNPQALASSGLRISYETNDLFSLASKTLIGARANYKITDKTSFGFTFVNLRQETLNDKVRIGEEPTNNSIFGFDFKSEFKLKPLTNFVNLLPGYNTKEESTVTINSEIAVIAPDPNTLKSRIPQDNNEAVAYIDDMEGAKKIISLGTTFSQWTISSLPVDSSIGISDSLKQAKRGKMRWFNIQGDVEVKKVYPARDVQPGQDRLTPLYIIFNPNQRGVYNYKQRGFDTTNKFTNWNGIMKFLNTTSTDLLNENIGFIEFNMKIENTGNNQTFSNAKICIDLGQISEDAIPNGILDTEDKNSNGQLDPNEDIGLDFLTDLEELALYNQINDTNLTLNDFPYQDPAGDNNSKVQGVINFDIINGTQNNAYFEGGNRPDTEDLNRNSSLDTYNAYFEYEISLDTTNNKRISGRGEPGSGWFQYRIPLSEFSKVVNNPSLTNIEFVRFWIKGVNQEVKLAIVDFNLVGNQWYKPDKSDTTYNISVVSIEENSQIYMSPVPGDILRQTIRNTSGVDTKSNEQSLSLEVKNLVNGQRKIVVKDYKTQTLDLFNYKVLKLFVNGDPSFNYTNEVVYDATMIIRFGTDSNNYYEYRAPIHPDNRPGQPWNKFNEVTIVFADLTSLKISRDSIGEIVEKPVPNGPPGSYYRIRGNPSLSSIKQFELGVEKNKAGPNAVLTGSVWFNEIRVLKVNDDNGYAMNLNASIKVADLANININFNKVDPNFHSVETRVGSRVTGTQWDIGISLNAHKIINNAIAMLISKEWKDFLNLPINFRHYENMINPKYFPGSDIELEKAAEEKYRQVLNLTNNENLAREASEAIKLEAQTLTVRDEFSINGAKINIPSDNYFIKTFVNSLSLNFSSMNQTYRDYTFRNKYEFSYNGALIFNTDFGFSKSLYFNINKLINLGEEYKEAKIYLFIPIIPFVPLFSDNFSASIDFIRSQSKARQRKLLFDDPIGRNFRSNRGFNFNWKFIENWIVDLTGQYTIKIGSDLSGFETYGDSSRYQRTGSEILKEIFFNNAFVNFGKDLDFQQTTVFNPKFNIPILKNYFDINLSYNVTYGWINPNTTRNVGFNVGFSNNINTTANLKIGEIFKIFKGEDDGVKIRTLSAQSQSDLNISQKNSDDQIDLLKLIRSFIPDNVSINFTQTNTVTNGGVQGRPGFTNFWFSFLSDEKYGPPINYQLGFNRNPGKRVPDLLINDNDNQTNSLTLNAIITPIIPSSIRVNLTFKKNFGKNQSFQYTSAPDGVNRLNSITNSTLTDGYSIFLIGDVDKFKYEGSTNPDDNIKNLSSSFKKDISSFPFPNWSLSISGLEAFPLFAEFATSVTLENTFTAEYNEQSKTDFKGIQLIDKQTITQSFNPLIGINITFKEIFGGNLTASFRLNKSRNLILTPSSSLIQSLTTNDFAITANFSKAGFDIPLFGLYLKNDISIALTISKNSNEPIDYRFNVGIAEPEKIPGSGSTVTTINPTIQYSLSSKVQLQFFYKYIRTEPLQNTLTTIPRTSNEGGLNIRISIN
ncbi:MAG: cell surface protein SprA [Ignavibacteria bacterium]|nr:cell surface protein SprA [Ignavibacteria bacterium]